MKVQQLPSTNRPQAYRGAQVASAQSAPGDYYTPEEIHRQDVRFNRSLSLAGYMGWMNPDQADQTQGASAIRAAATGRNILLAGGAAAGFGLASGLGQGLYECLGATAAGGAAGFLVGLAFIACSQNSALSCPEHARGLYNS